MIMVQIGSTVSPSSRALKSSEAQQMKDRQYRHFHSLQEERRFPRLRTMTRSI